MKSQRQLVNVLLLAVLLAVLPFLSAKRALAQVVDLNIATRQMLMADLKSAGVRVGVDAQRGVGKFIGASRYAPIHVPGVTPGATPSFNTMVIADKYGKMFGLGNARDELTLQREGRNATGGGKVHYQQVFKGIPVLGGEMIVNVDRGGALLSLNGEVGVVPKGMVLTPLVDRSQAADAALAAVAKWYRLPVGALTASAPELTIYDAHILGPGSSEPGRLVWRLEVRSRKLAPIRELVLVDARHGNIALHFNQVDTVKDRQTYSANNTTTLPGTLKCTETDGDGCTNGTNLEADLAHLYAGKTYDFYQNYHGRDSFDNAGGALISTVEYYDGAVCPNAYWDGKQMVYCKGFPGADDVVAHELTHAVTERTSNLFYYYQSGAINESLSDLWGEFVDLSYDGANDNDTAAVRWQLGEDINSPATIPAMVGAIRDMRNPPAFDQPDKMSSVLYRTDVTDNGGVHTNSGINNKAVYLLTDGDTFNAQTVSGLGTAKVARIYYEVQTNLLTSGADYQDLDLALNQGCANLLGTAGITGADCDQVRAATAAVEMSEQPAANFNPEAPVCAAGQATVNAFFDDLEGGLGKWTLTNGAGTENWVGFYATYHPLYGYSYATSGVESLFGLDVEVISDQRAAISVAVPTGQPYLHFRHAFDFENAGSSYYDGGVLEYSTDNGSTWNNAMGFFDSGKGYGGSIYSGPGGDNPLKGRNAFVGVSHGYVSTRLNLAPLAGQDVRFRWRVGTDTGTGFFGWMLDDVRVYTCNTPPVANAGAAQNAGRGTMVTLDGRGSTDSDGTIAAYSWVQTGGTAVTLSNANSATPSFTAPATLGALSFRLTVTDNQGMTASAGTTVTVANQAPLAEAGPAQTVNPGTPATLNGSASSDGDGSIAAYSWLQTGGIAVTLSDSGSATPSFTSPAIATTLTFRLTVTDNEGATGADTTTVTVQAPAAAAVPAAGGGGGGGCSLSRDGGGDPLLVLAFLAPLLAILRRRKG